MLRAALASNIDLAVFVAVALFALWYLRYYRVVKRDARQRGVSVSMNDTLTLMRTDIRLFWLPALTTAIGGVVVLAQTLGFSLLALAQLDPTAWAGLATVAASALGIAGVLPDVTLRVLVLGGLGAVMLIMLTTAISDRPDDT